MSRTATTVDTSYQGLDTDKGVAEPFASLAPQALPI